MQIAAMAVVVVLPSVSTVVVIETSVFNDEVGGNANGDEDVDAL